MSGHGKSIRIHLADGSPTGIRHAEVVNWTGQAIVCPRGRIGELSDWPESQRPGLYILLGEDPKSSGPLAYIGEAENGMNRLQQHAKGDKDFWVQVVFFTSKDENLTKAHVKYLEARVVELATKAKRIALANGNAPSPSPLPRSERDTMEEFLEPARILLGALGFTFLEPIRKTIDGEASVNNNGPLSQILLNLEVPKRKILAKGMVTDEGFVVLDGSVAAGETLDTLTTGYEKIRDGLIKDGSLVVSGETVRFTRDVLFNGPSPAASVVCGGMRTGRDAWKTETGTLLRELEDNLADAAGPHSSELSECQ